MTEPTKTISSQSLHARNTACTNAEGDANRGIVLVPLHGLSIVDVDGDDAKSFLQSKLTTDLSKLDTRGSAYGYSVDINGRVLFDAHIAKLDDHRFRIWSEPESTTTIIESLDKYIIMEDVRLTEIASEEQWLVAGDDVEEIDRMLGVTFQPSDGFVETDGVGVLAIARSARPARLLDGPSEALRAQLVEAGASYVRWEDWRDFEVAEGFVRTGFDLLLGQTIPLEVGSDLGIDYNKGCYLGQEVIERLRSRGTPNREYRRVRIDGEVDATPVDIVNQKGRNAGMLTSIAPVDDTPVGIAVIRRRALNDDVMLYAGEVDGPAIEIVGEVR